MLYWVTHSEIFVQKIKDNLKIHAMYFAGVDLHGNMPSRPKNGEK
jgi:hypothetical protein